MESCVRIVSKKEYKDIIEVTGNNQKELFRTVKNITLNDKLKDLVKKY